MDKQVQIYDVMMIGGGISSIAAAYYLSNLSVNKNKQIKWAVVQANDNLGGRLSSTPIDGRSIDLGAYQLASFHSNINKRQCALFELIQKGFCEISSRQKLDKVYYYTHGGKQIEDKQIKKAYQRMQQLQKNVTQWIKDKPQLSLQDCYNRFQKQGGLQGLNQQQLQTYRLMLLMEEHEQAEDADKIAADTFFSNGQMQQDTLDDHPLPTITYHGIFKKLVSQLQESANIYTNMKVVQININQQNCQIRAQFINKMNQKQFKIFKTRFVVCGVPLGVIKKKEIIFTPQLPNNYKFIFQNLQYASMQKIILAFQQPFWPVNAQRIKITSSSKDINLFPHFSNLSGPKDGKTQQNAHILCCYVTAKIAIQLLNKYTDQQIIQMTVIRLKKVFPSKNIKLKQGIVTRWKQKSNIQGSYTCIGPNLRYQMAKKVTEPINNKLWFVGEHCYPENIGCAHGAFQTGWQAAKSISQLV